MLSFHVRFGSHLTPPCKFDAGVRKYQQELTRLREVLIKLRDEDTKLKEKERKEGHIKELFEEQRRLRHE
jgi:hypothetical protein